MCCVLCAGASDLRASARTAGACAANRPCPDVRSPRSPPLLCVVDGLGMIRHVAFPLILLTHRPPISVRACHADRICVPLQLEAARGRDTEGSTCRQRVGTDTLHAEGARSGAAAAALALQCSERRRCCGRYQEGFAEALWPDRRTHVRQLRKATPSAACVRSPFSAFPCVLTAVQCLSLCAHCRSVPFRVCSLPFSAFPCVLTAVQCLSLCSH